MPTPKTRHIQLAVTEFAWPSPRTGSIEQYSGYGPLPDVGQEWHARIQADRLRENPLYIPEKWISHSFEFSDFKVTVSGRMDGFIPGLPHTIEEIKTAYQIDALKKALQREVHHPYKLQILTYVYLHHLQTGQMADARLHLVCARTGQSEDLNVPMDLNDFESWLKRRLEEIKAEDEMYRKLKERRQKVAKKFVFPFASPRTGQTELMHTIEKNLNEGRQILVQAPTGLGKTVAITFPALQEAMGRGQKAIYVTAKNTQHSVAEDAAVKLQENGAKVRAVTIHAKAKMCLKEETLCNPEHCEFARNYYSKVSEHQLPELLAKQKNLTAERFRDLGRTYEVCPFELQLEACQRADLVICDYNYVFSPHSRLGRIFNNGFGKTTPPNLIVDEAHNLPTRATEYFSAKVDYQELNEWYHQSALASAQVVEQMHLLLKRFQQTALDLLADPNSIHRPQVVEIHVSDFSDLAGLAQETMALHLSQIAQLKGDDPVLRFCQAINEFGQALLRIEPGSGFFCTYTPGPSLKVTCCDASDWLRERYAQFANVVLFSATLKPFAYFAEVLGVEGENLVTAEFASPFPKENRKLIVIPQVSTRLKDRSQNYSKIVEAIERIVRVKPGNYFVFFPSFDFLYQIHARLNLADFDVVAQTREMKREAVEMVLDQMRARQKPTLILAVQGGVFAEGVDYPGEMLIGAIVVGPALPTFDFERERLREYFDGKHEGQGFDYAYTYPAMAKVVQSAGRVIRSDHDRGLIVLMDRRFLHKNYLNAMPADWIESGELTSQQLIHDIQQFWSQDEA